MFLKTHYSILESTIKPKEGLSLMKEYGYKVVFLVDKQLFGALEFFYEAQKLEIKPILSAEIKVDGCIYQVVAKNATGFDEISKVLSTNKFFKTDNTFWVLKNFELAENLKNSNADYVGIDIKGDKKKNIVLEYYAAKYNIPIIPLEFPTHLKKGEYRNAKALNCIHNELKLDEEYLSKDIYCYIKSKEEFLSNYPKEWVKNISHLIKQCDESNYKFGHPNPPKFKFRKELAIKEELNPDISEEELFAYMSRKGLSERLKHISKEKHQVYKNRLEHEINIINQMKFPGYMLIVQDYTLLAKSKDIPVGPGRGSAAGSLVAYSMGITDIDPLPYGLLFERFLNPERVTMPDIDMDFCQERRQEVLNMVIERYGKENVAQIVTFGTLAAKGVIRDTSRILGYPLFMADKFAKIIPEKPGIFLKEAYDEEKEKIDQILINPQARRVWEYSQALEGLNRNLGVHAAGVVITDEPVYTKAPLYNVKGTQVVQFEGKYLEDVDLIKFDFLGLKTLSVIHQAIKLIKKNHNIDIVFPSDYNDQKVYEEISNGHTIGMFQIESDGMQNLCKRLKPETFENLIALIALYRPGPMESGMLESYVKRKRGEEEVDYFFDEFKPFLEPILSPTYGVIVYQEQVMQIVQEIGGFSLGEADIIRRAMGKKDIKYMKQKAEEFADGAVRKGLSREHAVELFSLIEKFAGYGFNKSHSAAYALISFQTAYLKTYYPAEFLTALLNFDIKNQDKIAKIIDEANRISIQIVKPNISKKVFNLFETDGKQIYFGLEAIKGVGVGAKSILEKLPYNSLQEFILKNRTDSPKMNKRVFESLVAVGVLDSFGYKRKFLIENSKELLDIKKYEEVLNISSSEQEEYTLAEIIKIEKDKTGVYLTDPFESIKDYISQYQIPELNNLIDGKHYLLVFPEEILKRKAKKTKKEFSILKGYFNKQRIEVLCFNEANNILLQTDINKPLILDVNYKNNSCFLNGILPFKKSSFELYFLKK